MIASFSRIFNEAATRVEILAGTALLLLWWRPVEVVEHQVHIGPLLPLQMIYYGFVPVHLNLDVCLSLSWDGSRFVKVAILSIRGRILFSSAHLLTHQLSLLLCLLVITYVESFPTCRYCGCLLLCLLFLQCLWKGPYHKLTLVWLLDSSVRIESLWVPSHFRNAISVLLGSSSLIEIVRRDCQFMCALLTVYDPITILLVMAVTLVLLLYWWALVVLPDVLSRIARSKLYTSVIVSLQTRFLIKGVFEVHSVVGHAFPFSRLPSVRGCRTLHASAWKDFIRVGIVKILESLSQINELIAVAGSCWLARRANFEFEFGLEAHLLVIVVWVALSHLIPVLVLVSLLLTVLVLILVVRVFLDLLKPSCCGFHLPPPLRFQVLLVALARQVFLQVDLSLSRELLGRTPLFLGVNSF